MQHRLPVIRGSLMLALSLFVLYQIKDRVRQVNRDITQMEEELAKEQEVLHVLEAEWSYLTRPERLQRLMQYYAGMETLTSDRVVTLAQLPDVPYVPVPARYKPEPDTVPHFQTVEKNQGAVLQVGYKVSP